MGTQLFTVPGHSPFIFHYKDGKAYQVGRIIFYHKLTGWRHTTPKGWISELGRNDNHINHLELKQDLIKRNTEKFDGKAFFIRNTRLNQFFHDKSLYVDLYLPFHDMNFEPSMVEIREGFTVRKIPKYASQDYPITIFDYDRETREESEVLKLRAIDLVAQIQELESKLNELNDELARIDPKDSIRNNLEEVRAKMNGAK